MSPRLLDEKKPMRPAKTSRAPGLAVTDVIAAVALAVAVLGTASCGKDFDPYNRLTALRVLAIKSEPVAPLPGQTTTLSALTYTPEPDPTLSYAWSWCPFAGSANDGYPCQVTEAELAMLAGQTGMPLPSLDLGTGPTAMLPNGLSREVLAQICAGAPGLPVQPDCEGGFPVQVKLRVQTATDEVITVRTLRLRFDDGTEPSTNPQIDGLLVTLDADVPITDAPDVTVPRKHASVIKAVVTETMAETYRGKNDDGVVADLRERLTLTWFVESGETNDDRTLFIPGITDPEKVFQTKWRPALTKDYAKETARLVVVIRDNRGGVGWRSGLVTLGAAIP
jgi:hypothetical protein